MFAEYCGARVRVEECTGVGSLLGGVEAAPVVELAAMETQEAAGVVAMATEVEVVEPQTPQVTTLRPLTA